MSLIPFILDLADELQEYQRCLIGGGVGGSAMDIDDVDFGLQSLHEAGSQNSTQQQQPVQQQQQQQQQTEQQQRRPRLLSQLCWPSSNILQKQHHHRHHPYAQTARLCCSGKDRSDTAASIKANLLAGLANKPTAYPVINKNGWMMVSMNVKQFTPDELIVKTIDNCIIVEGRHEDKEDIHGVISRHFIRKYMLPKGYDPNEVVSTLSSDGILTVKAPPPAPPQTSEEATERIVDIQQTGPAQTAVKQTAPSSPTPPSTPAETAAVEMPAAAAAAEVSPEQPNSAKDIIPEQAELNINVCEAPLEQPTQLEEDEAMQTEHIINELVPLLEDAPVDAQVVNEKQKCDVVDPTVVVVVAASEDVSSIDLNVAADAPAAAAAAAEKHEPAAEEMTAKTLAESAKTEMQVDIVAAAETAESAESLNNSNAAASADVSMSTADDADVADIVVVAATTDNGNDDGVEETKATDCNNSSSISSKDNNADDDTQLSSNDNAKEKNGIDAAAAADANVVADADATAIGAGAANETSIPVIKTNANVLPAEVPASLDLGVCVPKSVVIDAAAAAAVKETVADAGDTLEEKNGVDANGTNGDGVVADDGKMAVGVANIDTLPAAAEELVAN